MYTLSTIQIEDLFFNTDNLNVNSLFDRIKDLRDSYPSDAEIGRAVMDDAIEFALNMGQEDNHELIDSLVVSYIKRL